MKNINELIEVNLKLLSETDRNCLFADNFEDTEGNELNNTFRPDLFASEMAKRDLISIKDSLCIISEFGLEIVKNGGWKKHLTEIKNLEQKTLEQNRIKDKLELDLAKSNLEANKLNKSIAKQNAKNEKQNKISTWINIAIGIINIALLVWQILKAE